MRVYILIWNFNFGGAQKHAILLANAYHRKGAKVKVLVSHAQGPLKENLNPDIEIEQLKITKSNSPINLFKLRNLLLNHIPRNSVVVCNGPNNFRQMGRLNFLYKYWNLIFILHNDITIKKSSFSFVKKMEMRLLLRQSKVRVVALSQSQLVKHANTFKFSNGVVLPNFVELRGGGVHKRRVLFQDTFRLLCLGRLSEEKGHMVLIEAISKVKRPVVCDIYGEGKLKDVLEKNVRDKGIVLNIKNPEINVYGLFEKYDFLVLPSLSETFGMVIIEALSAGLPVVATDCDGPKELIVSGKNGLLAKRGDADHLATKIEEMCEGIKGGLFLPKDVSRTLDPKYTEEFAIEKYFSLFK
jgi:glycosyltransferase involved in cell wall biosynthesis